MIEEYSWPFSRHLPSSTLLNSQGALGERALGSDKHEMRILQECRSRPLWCIHRGSGGLSRS